MWATAYLSAVTVGSIRWRILKVHTAMAAIGVGPGYSGLDPMEDTERCGERPERAARPGVTVGSIRWRILKALWEQSQHDIGKSYSGLDPMEDTESERRFWGMRTWCQSYSGLDPMEDTERPKLLEAVLGQWELQWARSDGGY